jgi:hypothetical protein
VFREKSIIGWLVAGGCFVKYEGKCIPDLFAWLISHQSAVLFSHDKPATSNQPAILFSQNKPAPATGHQPSEHGDGSFSYVCL